MPPSTHLHALLALLALLPPLLSPALGLACAPGNVPVAGVCTPCPAGTYAHLSTRCASCPPNTFSPSAGTALRALCRRCPRTTFSAAGASACTSCPAGHVRSPTARVCLRCPPGTVIGHRLCLACRPGTVSAKPNALVCTACARGSTVSTDRTRCLPVTPRRCAIHREWYLGSCVACRFNSARTTRMSTCARCAPRNVAMRGGCAPCGRGTYGTNMYDEHSVRKCVACPNGTLTHGVGKPFCTAVSSGGDDGEVEECPTYTFRDADGDCNRCTRDEFRDVETNTCRACPFNTHSVGGLLTRCRSCPAGARVAQPWDVTSRGYSEHVSRCLCVRRGHVLRKGKCVGCPAGTQKGLGELRCERCGADEFNARVGGKCRKCAVAGTSSLKSGGKKCEMPEGGCMPGYAPSATMPGGCASVTTGCPPGAVLTRRAPADGGGEACVRKSGVVACAVGTFPDKAGNCLRCSTGFKRAFDATSRTWTCMQCPFGTFSARENARTCRSCPDGFVGTGDRCLCDTRSYIDDRRKCVKCDLDSVLVWSYDCHISTFLFL